MKKPAQPLRGNTHQTVLEINAAHGPSSIRIGFTDQRLTAYVGIAFWSGFLHKRCVRRELEKVLPHHPVSPNSYVPADVALGLVGGVICGADKLSREACLRQDSAIAQVLVTSLPGSYDALSVWRRYDGRGDSGNRSKEIGSQFGVKGLCRKKFWATQAACQLAIWA